MSVLDIIGFEDLPPVADSLLYETLMRGCTRAIPGTQSISMSLRNGRQWARVSGTSTTPAGYSTARCASLVWNLYTDALRTALLTKKVWVGYRYRTVLTSASQIPTSAAVYFNPNFSIGVSLLSAAEVADNTEFFFEFGIDWANKLVEVWRDGALLKTVAMPGWTDASFTALIFMAGYGDQDYSSSTTTAFARVFEINDIYMLIDDGVGLSKRLGPLKVHALALENVELGEGWGNASGTDPKSLLSQTNLTTAGKLTPVLRTSTKHSVMSVGFVKPSAEDNIEFVTIDVMGFRDEGTTTKFTSKIKADTAESAPVQGVVGFNTLSVTKVFSGEKTPNNTRWTPDNVDALALSINTLAGG